MERTVERGGERERREKVREEKPRATDEARQKGGWGGGREVFRDLIERSGGRKKCAEERKGKSVREGKREGEGPQRNRKVPRGKKRERESD